MRISTTMQFTNSLSYIQKSNTSVDEASNRYNSGLKFQTAGENPSGMASKVKYEGAISSYKQYAKDGGLAANTLSEEETALQSMWSALSSINTRLIQCVDGSNDQNSLIALAEEIGQTRDHLYDLMNTQNTDGEYIFSGAQSDIPTYTLTSDGHYVCQADGSTRSVLVAPSITVQVTDSGLDVFENCRLADTMTVTATPNIGSSVISSYGVFGDYDIKATNTQTSFSFDGKSIDFTSIKSDTYSQFGTVKYNTSKSATSNFYVDADIKNAANVKSLIYWKYNNPRYFSIFGLWDNVTWAAIKIYIKMR